MKKCVVLIGCLLTFVLGSSGLIAQANPTGSLTGVVSDPSGASIPGAAVVVTSETTHRTFNLQSDISGRFVLANLSPDQYDVTISHAGFQTGSFKAVAVQVGQVYSINAKLKVGAATQTVEVNAGQQVIETQSTTIANQVTGKQITEIPIASRNAQDLAIFLPSAQTTGSPRNSQFDGLPPGAVNLTFDGINSQDNLLKSSNGSSFFSTEQPRIDDVQEFSISTAATDASSSGEGAVQVAFVSKKGSNSFHGGGWEYLRNDALNANYYFNNLASPSLPRQRLRLNEFGYKLGGYLIKNKLFFFTDLDLWENPQGQLRQRNILTAGASVGQYTYTPVDSKGNYSPPSTGQLAVTPWVTCNGPAQTCTADLFAMMAAPGGGNGAFTTAADPIEAKMMSEVLGAVGAPGVSLGAAPGPNQQQLNFNAQAASHRRYPDLRLDYTINQANSLEFDYHYAYYFDGPDILNNADATYPVAPFNTNVGSQISNRNLLALAWRYQVTPTMNNELRVGGQSAPLWFNAGQTDGIYPALQTDLGASLMRPGVSDMFSRNPFASFSPGSRNTALAQLNDTLSWLHGNHAMTMGVSFTDVRLKDDNAGEQVSTVNVGMANNDPAIGVFTGTTLPNMGSNDMTEAENLYGSLAGHVTSFQQNVNVNPFARKFQSNFNTFDQITQREFSTFFSDSWHLTPNLTFNYGLRWEYEGTPVDDLNQYMVPVGGAAGVYGVSGLGNLFNPGQPGQALPGAVTSFINDSGQVFYKADKKDFAPSVGLAWTPRVSGGWLSSMLGDNGASVLRAGYSIAYDRPGLSNFTNLAPTNPGTVNGLFLNAGPTNNAATGQFTAGSILLSNQNVAGKGSATNLPAGYQFGQPLAIPTANSNIGQVNAYAPGLAQPVVQSWSVGWQRQINPNTAIEIDYVGNHGSRDWTTVNLNEVNIFESQFLPEFNAAVNNLAICTANAAACNTASGGLAGSKGSSFNNWGLQGQANLPIMTAAFVGPNTTSGVKNFQSSRFIGMLNAGEAGALANQLTSGTTLAFWQNMVANGLPSNLLDANPDASGGAFMLEPLNQSTYNSLQVQLRRRLANDLQFNANYTYSHAFSTGDVMSLRNYGSYKAPSPTDLRNVFKVQSHYDLPFGPGHRWTTGNGWVNTVIGGWSWDGITRWQSGDRFEVVGGNTRNNFSGQTVNSRVDGVNLIGTSTGDLQQQVGVIKGTNSSGKGTVFFGPNSLIASNGRSNTAVVGPCSTAGAFCQAPYLYGPGFFRADWSLAKTTKLSEGVNLLLRADVMDAFNNVNFSTPTADVTSTSFMRITSGYQDFTSTQDPGGRFIQIQARIDF